jgi:4-hydroxy-tetrahydrodipicolinate synthase
MSDDLFFRGLAPALLTPFADGDVDLPAFRRLIAHQLEGGVDALVVLGTTGENPTVTDAERRRLVDTAVDAADGRVPVIVGTGTNSTAQSVTYSREAAAAGADGLLVVGPYYNKPSQSGFVAHVERIAAATDRPILLYNVPSRTSFNIEPDTVLHLAETVPTVRGVKEASGDPSQIADILADRPDGFAVYSGDDEMTLPLLTMGGDGVVSVISNVLPGAFRQLVTAGLQDDIATARAQHVRLLTAMRACFYETNPVPVKTVCAALGLMRETVRLPLVSLDANHPVRKRILAAFNPHVNADLLG